jgi:hypothetical protein
MLEELAAPFARLPPNELIKRIENRDNHTCRKKCLNVCNGQPDASSTDPVLEGILVQKKR